MLWGGLWFESAYKVYILQSERNGRYYIGFTKDIESRIDLHNKGRVKSTRYIRPLLCILRTMILRERRDKENIT